MSNNYGPTFGLLGLFIPLLLPACASQQVQRRAKPASAQVQPAEPAQAEPAEQAEPDEPGCAARCLNEQLSWGASFEEGEPEDYAWQASGLGIYERSVGTGEAVEAGDQVTFEYISYRLDGCAFDATELREPITIPLEGMIPGVQEGMIGMQVGGQRRLYIPAELAYGEKGAGSTIGPNEVLVFEIELLGLP